MGPLRVRLLGEVRSTQEELWVKRRWLEQGSGVAASAQTAGTGRSAKRWISPEGGLYLSVLVGRGLRAQDADVLGEAAALAVLHACDEFLKADALHIKWPNDVITRAPRDKIGKLAGVIVRLETEGDLISNAVVGIGVNVRKGIESQKLEEPGTAPVSLEGLFRRRGVPWSASRVKVLEWIVGWYGVLLARARADPNSVRDEFSREVARTPVSAHVEGYREQLKPLRVERGGALEVRRESGKKAVVSVSDSEALSWKLVPEAAPRKKVTARGARRPSSPRRSSRGRTARSARPPRGK